MGDARENLAATLRRAAELLRGTGLPADVEAVAAGPGGLLASGGGEVRIWREGRYGL